MREHLKVSRAFNGLFYARADVLCPRTPIASCERPSPRLPTIHRTRTHPLTFLRPIPIANPIRQMTLATAAPIIVRRPRAVNTGRIPPPGGRGRGDSRAPSSPPRRRRDSPCRRRDDSRCASPPSHRDDYRHDDNINRSGYGRNRRESPPPAGRYRQHTRPGSFS